MELNEHSNILKLTGLNVARDGLTGLSHREKPINLFCSKDVA